ncbi:MAG TPA: chemotaxis protein CheB [Acidimicrobiales bacterium]|nr:chemotaxis protein CheB [Acidimicrobiales bacterium]
MEERWSGAVVALVCSAGGLGPLVQVLGGLPGDLPAAVIVVQHVDPLAKSLLAEILDRRSALDVRAATSGAPLRAGQVLVAPPGRHAIATTDGALVLIRSGPFPPNRPSADLLLTSLAITAGPQAIAVVLSGHGHDGATGATAIHELGGTVIAATAASSQEAAMPTATAERDHIVDHVVSVDEIARLVASLVTPAASRP